MSQLLLDKDRSLRQAKEGDEVRTLARVRMLTVLPRLDAYRKRTVMRFLYEADLIHKDRHIIDLAGANLSEAYLRGVNLRNANLFRANLSKANLIGASLSDAKLYRANLSSAALIGAHLIRTDLEQVNLRDADLSGAHLTGANLTKALVTSEQLEKCKSLREATMPNGQPYEDWLKSKDREENRKNDGTS